MLIWAFWKVNVALDPLLDCVRISRIEIVPKLFPLQINSRKPNPEELTDSVRVRRISAYAMRFEI